MRVPVVSVSSSSIRSADLGSPTFVVFLVLALGATVFLWRARYIRRRTAYVMMAIIVLGLIILGALMYTSPA
jgi:uncharacterized membrane protein